MKKCPKCGSRIREGSAFCVNCGAKLSSGKFLKKKKRKSHKKIWGIVAIAVLLLLGAVIVHLMLQNKDGNVVVANVEEVISLLKESGQDYGYENALSELTEKYSSDVEGDKYYRLQQNFKGIPVHGRSVVYATDKHGKALAITGNVVDINAEINLTPSINQEDANLTVSDYLKHEYNFVGEDVISISQISFDDLYIYCNNGGNRLVYEVNAICRSDSLYYYTIIIDAHSAEILSVVSTLNDESVTGYKASDTERKYGFPVEKYGEDVYILEDTARGIIVQNFDGLESSTTNLSGESISHFTDGTSSIVVSDDIIFGNGDEARKGYEEAATLLQNASRIQDYFIDLGIKQQTSTGNLVLYYNDGYGEGRNARGGRDGDGNGILSMGQITGVEDIDVMAHEYGHVLSYYLVNWVTNSVENYAINEATSDVYGELVEAWYYGNPDAPNWIIQGDNIDVRRNLFDPSETGNAKSTAGIPNNSEISNDHIKPYGYQYSTVISRVAYLLWNGGTDGNTSKKIPTEDIAMLWYRTLLMMPADCDFWGFRELMELAAESMSFTEKQLKGISEAFDEVGISGPNNVDIECDYNLQKNFELSVYESDGLLCDNYAVQIRKAQSFLGFNIKTKPGGFAISHNVTKREPYTIELAEEGTYIFTITNNENPENTVIFTADIREKKGDPSVSIYTHFNGNNVRGVVYEIVEENGAEIHKPVTEAKVSIVSHADQNNADAVLHPDIDGYFEDNLPVGNYTVSVEADGYISQSISFSLTETDSVQLPICLSPLKAKPEIEETTNNNQENPTNKQLLKANTRISDSFTEEYVYSYNDAGQLIKRTNTSYNNGAKTFAYDWLYLYDSSGKMIAEKDSNSNYNDYEYHYDGSLLTGYTYNDIRENRIVISTTYHFEHDAAGNVVSVTTNGTDPDVWTKGKYSYDGEGHRISGEEEEKYGDHYFERKFSYDYSYPGMIIITKEETMFDFTSTSRFIQIRDFEKNILGAFELLDGYSIKTDKDGYITEVVDANGTIVHMFEYIDGETTKSTHGGRYDKNLVTGYEQAIRYLEDEIIPNYVIPTEKMTATYYCQTYGGMAGQAYATTSANNLYTLSQIRPWLLAYNVADYNSDRIADLFVITLEGYGEGEIGQAEIKRRIYMFDENGQVTPRAWFNTAASASQKKMVFAFLDDKLVELSFSDYSMSREGDNATLIEYPITDKLRYHDTSINVKQFNPNTNELEFILSFYRHSYPNSNPTWGSDYGEYKTEYDAMLAVQDLLHENYIFGIEMPISDMWVNRWSDDFYLTDEAEWNAFKLEISSSPSEIVYGVELVGGPRYDEKGLLNTTTGTTVFSCDKYELSERSSS